MEDSRARSSLPNRYFHELLTFVQEYAAKLDGVLFCKVDRAARSLRWGLCWYRQAPVKRPFAGSIPAAAAWNRLQTSDLRLQGVELDATSGSGR